VFSFLTQLLQVPTAEDCLFEDNAAAWGGAIHLPQGVANVSGSSFNHNTGAVQVRLFLSLDLRSLVDCLVSSSRLCVGCTVVSCFRLVRVLLFAQGGAIFLCRVRCGYGPSPDPTALTHDYDPRHMARFTNNWALSGFGHDVATSAAPIVPEDFDAQFGPQIAGHLHPIQPMLTLQTLDEFGQASLSL
jgi:hypothetical protein